MSRSITQTSSSGSAVAAGSSVIAPVFTTTGFSAGDYVYTTPTGVGTRTTGNVNLGSDRPYVGTTWLSTGLQSSAFRTASYGPYVDQGTYTGTTRTFASIQIANNTVKAVPSYQTRSCTLANGNVVLMYNTGATLYFKVIDSTGATVVAETTLTTILQTNTRSGNFACCTLASGNIQFAWTPNTGSYQLYVAQYSPAGAVVVAANDQGAYVASPGNFSMAALSGGGSVLCGSSGLTNIIYAPTFHIYNSSGTIQTGGTASYGVGGGGSYYVPCVGLPSTSGTNIWVYCAQELLSSVGYNPVVGVYTGGSSVTSATISSATGTSGGETMSITVATDGTIVMPVYASNSIYYQKLTYTKSTNTTGSLSVGSTSYLCVGNSAIFSSLADGSISCVSNYSNSIYLSTLSSSNTITGPTLVASPTFSAGTGNPGTFSAASFGSGLISVLYIAYTTTYVGQIGAATIAATNGVTSLTGNSYLPSGGYYLMGVAATDAAANSTGQVIMNGTAQLGSSYPTVTTPIYYSYQTTASQPIFGQRGSVSATTVTLKGLE
jgi:hypothetical protein